MIKNSILTAAAALLLLSTGCIFQDSENAGSVSAEKPKIRLEVFSKGYSSPVHIVFPEKRKDLAYVVEQEGKIFRIENGKKSLFLDISDWISSGYELGLLSMAVEKSYEEKDGDRIFINYTTERPHHTIVASLPLQGRKPEKKKQRIHLKFAQPYSNHNGGLLAFGPDGMLYVGTGDGGSAGDPQNNAQNTNNLLGKILRIDVSSDEKSYTVPSDNPVIKGKRSEIFAWGLRNPWRFSIDRKNGRIYAGDVGQDRIEEISLVGAGENHGWRIMEGDECYRPKNCSQSGLAMPIYTYSHKEGYSVTGGYVYRGSRLKSYSGYYFFSDFGSGTLWALPLTPEGRAAAEKPLVLIPSAGNISSFGEDSEGELYMLEYRKGIIYKITE